MENFDYFKDFDKRVRIDNMSDFELNLYVNQLVRYEQMTKGIYKMILNMLSMPYYQNEIKKTEKGRNILNVIITLKFFMFICIIITLAFLFTGNILLAILSGFFILVINHFMVDFTYKAGVILIILLGDDDSFVEEFGNTFEW